MLVDFTADGRRLAVFATVLNPGRSSDDDAYLVEISILDLCTGEDRPIWSAPGGHVLESWIAWSPDEQHIAAAYNQISDDWGTVVVTPDGQVTGPFDNVPIAVQVRGPRPYRAAGSDGVWVVVGRAPSAAKTASKVPTNVASRSRIKNRNVVIRSPRSIRRMRAYWVVHEAVGCAVTPRMCARREAISITTSTWHDGGMWRRATRRQL